MKKLSISGFLLFASLVALAIALVASQISNYSLRSENAELLEALDSRDFIIDGNYQTIQQYRLGAAYLVRLSKSEKEWSKFMPFLAAIDRHGFAFRKIELERLDGYSIYCYYEAKRKPDLSKREDYNPHWLCLLVNDKTLAVVDSIMSRSNGLLSVGLVGDEQDITWDNPDGSMTEYRILETGFVPALAGSDPAE